MQNPSDLDIPPQFAAFPTLSTAVNYAIRSHVEVLTQTRKAKLSWHESIQQGSIYSLYEDYFRVLWNLA